MSGKSLRWGVLGTARIADALVKGIEDSPDNTLVAVASRDIETAREWAQARDVPYAFGSYEEMIASSFIDAVYIPLPNGLHKEWSIKAAQQGKHVLCEKPVTVSAQEVGEMIEASEKYGVKIMEAFMYRFHPQIGRVRKLVADGVIGETRIVRATFDFFLRRPHDVRWSKELGGGALLDVGSYCVNVTNLLVGMLPEAVTASAVWATTGVDMSLVGTLEYPNGVLGAIDCSFQVGSAMQQRLAISGTEGLISVARPFSRSPEEKTFIVVDKADNENAPEHIEVEGADHYQLMVAHFTEAVLNDKALSYPLEESMANMRVLEALLDAARTGRRVAV